MLRMRGVIACSGGVHIWLHRDILLLARGMTRSRTEVVELRLQMRDTATVLMWILLIRGLKIRLLIGKLIRYMRCCRIMQPNPSLVDLKQILDQGDKIDSLRRNKVNVQLSSIPVISQLVKKKKGGGGGNTIDTPHQEYPSATPVAEPSFHKPVSPAPHPASSSATHQSPPSQPTDE